MPCYKPLKAYFSYQSDGKKKLFFVKEGMPFDDSSDNALYIPCGRCLGCRLDYSRQWATRICLEAKKWQHNYFVTLTYNEDFVPLDDIPFKVSEDGEVLDSRLMPNLHPEHLQYFLKRLRTIFKRDFNHDNIRFFACGEYGSKNLRPHFHLILFNCPLSDLVPYKKNSQGDMLYLSPLIERAWSITDSDGNFVPRGFCTVGEVSYQSASYVARYMLKKVKSSDDSLPYLQKEFTRMSLKPGIGSDFFDSESDRIYFTDSIYLSDGRGREIICKPPRYYDKKLESSDPVRYKLIKDRRSDVARSSLEAKKSKLQIPYSSYLDDEFFRLKRRLRVASSRDQMQKV